MTTIPAITSERTARAALTILTEPDDRTVGAWLATHPATVVVNAIIQGNDHGNPEYAALIARAQPRTPGLARLDAAHPHDVVPGAIGFLIPSDAEWPTRLNDLGVRRPHGLWVRGNVAAVAALNDQPVAVITGARASTSDGEAHAHTLSVGLVDAGFSVVGGGAYGVEAAALRGALTAGACPVIVLAAGVARAYPTGNTQLFEDVITAGGAVISDIPVGATPTKWRFISTKRIVASLGHVVTIVQSGWRSGSLVAATNATDLHRPVTTVPGSAENPVYAGNNRLLDEGLASPVHTAADIIATVSAAA